MIMKLTEAYNKLLTLSPLCTTLEAAGALNISPKSASLILSRLAESNLLIRLQQGKYAFSEDIDHLILPAFLTTPSPSYISLYTALYYHGMIEQIPSVIYAVTVGKTKRYETTLATVSVHHIQGKLFTGFEPLDGHNILMASPEKALFDTLYLMPARSNLFKKLTELSLPSNFNKKQIRIWLSKIENKSRREAVARALSLRGEFTK